MLSEREAFASPAQRPRRPAWWRRMGAGGRVARIARQPKPHPDPLPVAATLLASLHSGSRKPRTCPCCAGRDLPAAQPLTSRPALPVGASLASGERRGAEAAVESASHTSAPAVRTYHAWPSRPPPSQAPPPRDGVRTSGHGARRRGCLWRRGKPDTVASPASCAAGRCGGDGWGGSPA